MLTNISTNSDMLIKWLLNGVEIESSFNHSFESEFLDASFNAPYYDAVEDDHI